MPTIRLVKTQKGVKATVLKKAAVGAPPTTDLIMDNQDQSFTLQGVDVQGAPVDISGVATIVVTSDAPTIFSVDPPAGMTVQGHALLPGTANLTFVATFTAGGIGPFTITQPITVSGSAATGLVVTPGTPGVR